MSVEKIVVGIIAALFQSMASVILVNRQIKIRKNVWRYILLFICFLIYFTLISLFVTHQPRFFFFIIFTSVINYFVLNEKSKNVMLYSFNAITILSIAEIIISILLVIFGIKSTDIVNNIFWNLAANILISILSIIIISINFVNKIVQREIKILNKKKYLMNSFCIFIIVIYLIVAKNGLEFVLRSNYYINILFVFGVIVIITMLLKNEHKAEKLKEQNQQMLNYVTKYEKIITEQGKTNHEFKNQLMVIKGYAQMNSEKLIKYLDSITKDFNKTTSSYLISQLNKFPDGGIKGLLYYKLSIMEDEKVNYEIDIESGVKTKLKKVDIETYKNITKVLGVLLDNAIEASKKSKEKNIIILVSKDNKDVIFSISNTYKGKIDIDKIGTGYTTKGKGHGYGLRLVNDIIENQKELSIENELDNGYYTTKLIININ